MGPHNGRGEAMGEGETEGGAHRKPQGCGYEYRYEGASVRVAGDRVGMFARGREYLLG